jgi:MFS family permease
MISTPRRGFGSVLRNRAFRSLWVAQALAQTAQQATSFLLMVLVEELTGSSTHIGLVILAFSLPGVLFSTVAGVAVDRWPKKLVLVSSNALRVLLMGGFLLVLSGWQGWGLLLGIYAIAFIAASVSQFFAPAEAATIPLLVGEGGLLPANSLFNLTLAISQVAGIIILGPLVAKAAGTRGAFAVIGVMYLGATLAVSRLPNVQSPKPPARPSLSRWGRAVADLREGWTFVASQKRVLLAMAHLTLVSTVVMIMAMLAPGFASRVLGKAPEDAVIVFAPAGVGMLLTTALLGRFGYRMRKTWASNVALALVGLGFIGLGLISQGYRILPGPLLHIYPQARLSLQSGVMMLSLWLGMSISAVSILGQTTLQQASPPQTRGRVFALQFMLNNLIGIPPMLSLGGLADWVGIPQVMLGVGAVVFVAAAISISLTLYAQRRASARLAASRTTDAARRALAWQGLRRRLTIIGSLLRGGLAQWARAWAALFDRVPPQQRPGHASASHLSPDCDGPGDDSEGRRNAEN